MREIPLTQGKFAVVDDEDFDRLSKHKWYLLSGRYAARDEYLGYQDGKTLKRCVLMHREIINPDSGLKVDHINGDGLFNRKENLRICTQSENCSNSRKLKTHSSQYKGVWRNKRKNKWATGITKDRKAIHLGYFEKEEDAAQAYNLAAIKYHGEFARLNEMKEVKNG